MLMNIFEVSRGSVRLHSPAECKQIARGPADMATLPPTSYILEKFYFQSNYSTVNVEI